MRSSQWHLAGKGRFLNRFRHSARSDLILVITTPGALYDMTPRRTVARLLVECLRDCRENLRLTERLGALALEAGRPSWQGSWPPISTIA